MNSNQSYELLIASPPRFCNDRLIGDDLMCFV